MARLILITLSIFGLITFPAIPVQAEATLYGNVHLSFDDWDETDPASRTAGTTPHIAIINSMALDRDVREARAKAEAAIANCDKKAYTESAGVLEAIGEEFDDDSLFDLLDELDARWKAAEKSKTCYADNYSEKGLYELYVGANMGSLRLSKSIGDLAAEIPATPDSREFNLGKFDNRGDLAGISSELRIPLGRVPNWMPNMPNVPNTSRYNPFSFWDFFFGLNHANADFNEIGSSLSTGGRDLLLPGVGTGPNPSGFVIGAANSDVTNITYDGDYDFGAYEFGFGKAFKPRLGTTIRPFGGLQYGHSDSHQMFSGVTNAATLPFSYTTNIDNKFWAPFVGVELATRPPLFSRAFGTPVELMGTFRYAYAFNDADGYDTLDVQGFVPGTAKLKNNDDTHDFSIKAGLTFNPDGPFSLSIGGGFEKIGNVPDVTRDGTSLSQLHLYDANAWTGNVRLGFKF